MGAAVIALPETHNHVIGYDLIGLRPGLFALLVPLLLSHPLLHFFQQALPHFLKRKRVIQTDNGAKNGSEDLVEVELHLALVVSVSEVLQLLLELGHPVEVCETLGQDLAYG